MNREEELFKIVEGHLKNRFKEHLLSEDKKEECVEIRREAFHLSLLSLLISKLCPDSREKSLAITKLEEAVFWANASIARSGGGLD